MLKNWYRSGRSCFVIDLSQFTDGVTDHQTPALLLLFLQVFACHQAGDKKLRLNEANYPDIRGFNEKITRGFQKQFLPISLRLERTKSVCFWSAAMFHWECGHPKEKSHILSKQKICPQCSLQISFTVLPDQCKPSSQMNCVESTVSIPNYENLNFFIYFSWGGPQIAEVFSSRINFALLPQTKSKENVFDRMWQEIMTIQVS